MRKTIIPIVFLFLALTSCEKDYLNLEPLDKVTESVYFNKPEHFLFASNKLYEGMVSWRPTKPSGLPNDFNSRFNDFIDFGSDLDLTANEIGRGSNVISNVDKYWTNTYYYLRDINIVLEKANEFNGDESDISEYVGAAYFFRAWQHFFLLQRFGGVPIVTTVLDLDSPELFGARNSRYEVVDQIILDLDEAINKLPKEQNIGSGDKGKISSDAAKAFKAKVLLYEATWEKYVGTTTDFQGSGGSSANIAEYFNQVATLCKDVIDNGGYSLWNNNSSLDNYSNRYLFNLEDSGSNPAGLDKSTNNEFIIQSIYDFELRQANTDVSLAFERFRPNRKFMDLFLCTDGLPIDKSGLFGGYNKTSDEFLNRDFRMASYFNSSVPTDGSVGIGSKRPGEGLGLALKKFFSYKYGSYRAAQQEAFNYPHLRLAEVYLMYAEAILERDGSISDADLNYSLNKVRTRAGVAPLTNALASSTNLDIMEEIRRERAIELFAENSRFNDLKRWGIAESVLNETIYGAVIEDTEYEGNTNLYVPSDFVHGTTAYETVNGVKQTLVTDPSSNRNFTRKNYLFPIPQSQIILNPSLVQNPNW
ncbi:RagB/SusD family nutrient uptake outer membrane protein [Polaribacter reichenbachii]|uniref:Carbohydrate-binding protein SusD n=1 Tax=Polaribacter reichenbachii TaxID=996801 RepID=A0A1B8TYC5_9FLAO|nr:RagB/SusD family nutrient uptake outer membrane protein [Polaribacter reichenbachii]APZ45847.1 RagB/SusD family nutrient uptake outer membrane protein [Polaribacter reichenbachii]AUC19709.1 RagB/SusD family nutrient uptake outer membrane protein [Polaribacter reichenbachii]OBY64721.1 hypothetical protein LPB301_09865 [Polaribacter reichenbachii]